MKVTFLGEISYFCVLLAKCRLCCSSLLSYKGNRINFNLLKKCESYVRGKDRILCLKMDVGYV